MKRFLDGIDQENSKTQGGKGQIRKIQEKQEGKNGGKKKKRFFLYITTYMEVPILTHVFSIGREHTQAIALVQPSLWRTHSYGNNWALLGNFVENSGNCNGSAGNIWDEIRVWSSAPQTWVFFICARALVLSECFVRFE